MASAKRGGRALVARALVARALAETARVALRLRVTAALRPPPPPYPGGRPLRVAVLSAYPRDHYGTVARFSRWVPHLEARGARVEILTPATGEEFASFGRGDADADRRFLLGAVRSVERNVLRAARADVIVLHRGLLPFGPWQRPTLERALARLNPRIVYDFYDAIWLQRREARLAARSAPARWLHPSDAVEAMIRAASTVTVTGEHLARFARDFNEDVRIVPMMVEPSDYEVKSHREAGPVVLGWMGNRWNIPKLVSMAPGIRSAAERAPLRLRVVSSDPVEIPGLAVESLTHAFSPESERADLAAIDIGLLPLEDRDYDRGKFPLKLLQYAAAGLPVIASRVAGELAEFTDGESILLADGEGEVAEAVTRLAADPGLRTAIGGAARQVVLRRYSFAASADSYFALLEQTASRRSP